MDCIVSIVRFTNQKPKTKNQKPVLQCLGALNSWSGRTQNPDTPPYPNWPIDMSCLFCSTYDDHHPGMTPYPSWSVDMSCLFCSKYDDNTSVFPQLWYNPYPLYARGLGLCLFSVRWSVICCQDGCFMDRQRRITTRHVCEKYSHIDIHTFAGPQPRTTQPNHKDWTGNISRAYKKYSWDNIHGKLW